MPNTYTISITGAPLGNAATGVIQQVAWKMTATDGTNVAETGGVAILPPIDPGSPQFIPLPQVTVAVLLTWAQALLDIPDLKAALSDKLIKAAQAAQLEVQSAAPVPLQLAPAVAAQVTAGVPV